MPKMQNRIYKDKLAKTRHISGGFFVAVDCTAHPIFGSLGCATTAIFDIQENFLKKPAFFKKGRYGKQAIMCIEKTG